MEKHKPFIADSVRLAEITPKVIGLSIILTILLAVSNAYLALKVGILASASIPAAIVSMGVLGLFKNSTILENNLVQTAASAGEAVAGGIVYTIPALIMLQFWQHFSYWENVAIAASSGLLGVFFSIPLRKVLVTDPKLPFPEGRAIAEVLVAGSEKHFGLKEILISGLVGAFIEFSQMGLQLLAEFVQGWWRLGSVVVGFGSGFSATMIGIGYIVGINIGWSIFIGAVLGWFFGIPAFSFNMDISQHSAADVAMVIWQEKLRYVGIGAMLIASFWTLLTLLKPFAVSIIGAMKVFRSDKHYGFNHLPRTERDFPIPYVFLLIILLSVGLYGIFYAFFPLESLQLGGQYDVAILLGSVIYAVVVGAICSAITGYFSGMVGVTASPGSAIIIAGLLFAAIMLRMVLGFADLSDLLQAKQAAAAITIILGAIITGAAAIANDNIQDLKVGYIVGSTPWKQQLMLVIGVLVSALIIPWVMELLFQVYGIGDVLPHPGMDIHKALPAPPAAIMAAVTMAVFNFAVPWYLMGVGAIIVFVIVLINAVAKTKISILGVAMGIYLPLATSTALFIGALVSYLVGRNLAPRRHSMTEQAFNYRRHHGVLIACGLVSGTALMNIVLAIPFAFYGNPNMLRIVSPDHQMMTEILGAIVTILLCCWVYRAVCHDKR